MELITINDIMFYCSCSKPIRNFREANFSVGTLSTLDCCGTIWYSIAGDARTYVSSSLESLRPKILLFFLEATKL